MAQFRADGLGNLAQRIEKLKLNNDKIEEILKAGSQPINEQLKANIQALPERPQNEYGTESNKATGILRVQKIDLLHDVGVTPMQHRNGYFDVKIGYYNGYLRPQTKRWPEGTPTQMLARSLEKGTSWLNKRPVVKPAYNQAKDKVVPAMQQKFEEVTKE